MNKDNAINKVIAGLMGSQSARLFKQTQQDLAQTGVVTPGDYDQDLGLFTGTEADGSQVRYKPGSATATPDQISVVKTAHTQIAFGDWL